MHRMHNNSKTLTTSQTSGLTLHEAMPYDILAGIMKTGVNGSNSRMVVEMAKIQPGDKVLDVGCGTGSLTLTAERYAGSSGSIFGIDASPEMVAAARKKAKRSGSRVIFDLGLIEKLAFPDATFDAVINRLMVHHLPDDIKRRGFAEIFRVLKPGGLLFIADFTPPSNRILAHLTSALIHPMMMQSNPGILPPMLKEAGFIEITSGPTRSSFLAYVSGKKPAA